MNPLQRLKQIADPERAVFLQRFFKTGPGQYAEGDKFLGITVPQLRSIVREFRDLDLGAAKDLLASEFHEARLLALMILADRFKRADEATRAAIYKLYIASTDRINNWDLVDASAPHIVGAYLEDKSRAVLRKLARSKSLWERRIAMVATQHFIRKGDLHDAFEIAESLLKDTHDLIHKAVGWMLREAGKKDRAALEAFLEKHARAMPRTALRYAIEHFDAAARKRYMAQ